MKQTTMDDMGKLVLRIALGVMILLHGFAKLRNGVDPIEGMLAAHGLPTALAYGALVGEVVAPLMVLMGLYARIGALLIAVNMLFAIGLAHMAQLSQLNEQGGWPLEVLALYLARGEARALDGPDRCAAKQP
jgi:putative oxidoreductase